MASLLDFKLFNSVLELRFNPSVLYADKRGYITRALQTKFKNASLIQFDENGTSLLLEQSRVAISFSERSFSVSNERPKQNDEAFKSQCVQLSDFFIEELDIDSFNRIGNRFQWKNQVKTRLEVLNYLSELSFFKEEAVISTQLPEHLNVLKPYDKTVRFTGDKKDVMLKVGLLERNVVVDFSREILLQESLQDEVVKKYNSTNVVIDIDWSIQIPTPSGVFDASGFIDSNERDSKALILSVFKTS